MDWLRAVDWIVGLGAWAGLGTAAIVGVVLWRMWPVFTPRREVDAVRRDIRDWRVRHAQDHAEMTARLDRGEARFVRLEGRIDGLPTHADLTALTTLVADLGGQCRELNGRLEGIGHATQRLERAVDMLTENELKGQREGGS
jgi:hypothetical protein